MNAPASRRQVLVVLDQNLGQVRTPGPNEGADVLGVDLHPHAVKALVQLGRAGAEVIVLAPVGDDVCVPWELGGGKAHTVLGWQRDLAATLTAAERRLGAPLEGALFVAADRFLRGEASALGLRPLPHLACAPWALRGQATIFVRMQGPPEALRRVKECIPCRLEHIDGLERALALVSTAGMVDALRLGLDVQTLTLDPAMEDLLLVKLDRPLRHFKALAGARVVFGNSYAVGIALGPERREDDLGLHGAHGHNALVSPNPMLFDAAPGQRSEPQLASWLRTWPASELVAEHVALGHLKLDLGLWSCPATSAQLEADVRRYSGGVDPGGGPIRSRHVLHPDNSRVVDMLVADLHAMGYCAHKFAFSHGGRTLHNVVADLPGRGTIHVAPDLRAKLREIFLAHPPWPPRPDPPWRRPVEALLGSQMSEFGPHRLDDEVLRLRLEQIFDLSPSLAWWRRCPLPGIGAGLIILGCHLDSTAGRDGGFDPASDAAPGVDDDASGMAATLAIARNLAGRARQFRHTIRFCFFNAEEQGLAGSRAYAAHLKAWSVAVRAVICTDMIGYNSDADRIFEIHAGSTDPAVRDLSVPIAQRIANWAVTLDRPGPAQIYKGTSPSGGADRDLVDGAIDRSDHAAFQEQGYPAVVVSEDFFVNRVSEPGADPNPNYHRGADTTMDFGYAAEIACVVSQAVKEIAQ